DQPVSIGVSARHSFNLYDKDQDFEGALTGPKGIIPQLRRNFRPKGNRLEPQSGPEPPPLSQAGIKFDVKSPNAPAMAAQDRIELKSGTGTTGRWVTDESRSGGHWEGARAAVKQTVMASNPGYHRLQALKDRQGQ